MKITVSKRGITTTINTKKAQYPWQYRDAFVAALMSDGLCEGTINKIFNRQQDAKSVCMEESAEEVNKQELYKYSGNVEAHLSLGLENDYTATKDVIINNLTSVLPKEFVMNMFRTNTTKVDEA
jgi:hypothetical protein